MLISILSLGPTTSIAYLGLSDLTSRRPSKVILRRLHRHKPFGMKNGLCSYVEIVGPPDAKNTIRCHFTKEQVNKLVFAMRNNNAGAWSEYYNNNNVCTTETPGWD